MQPIYLCCAVHGISVGGAVIDTIGDDRQKNTLHVFKGSARGALSKRPCPLSVSIGLSMCILESLQLSSPWHPHPVDGPTGRQTESTSPPPTFICRLEQWDVAGGRYRGTDHLVLMYHWNTISCKGSSKEA